MIASRIRRFFGANDGRPLKHGLVAALVVGIIMATAGGSYAYWTTSASVSSNPRAATLVVTASAVSLAATYGNDALTSTSYVSVRNDTNTASTTVPGLSITLSSQAGGDGTLAGAAAIQAWAVTSPAACTAATAVPGSGVFGGSWGGGVTVTGLSVAKTATTTICVRSTIADRTTVASSSGTRTFTPVATATINVANFVAGTAASATQSTQYIYSAAAAIDRKNWFFIKPQSAGCWDVEGGAVPASSGTTFISYPCKPANDNSNFIWNQQWTFLATDSGYAEIKPRSGPTLRVDAGATAASSLVLSPASATPGADDSQEWMVQAAGTGVYQFVNRVTGLCMTTNASSAGMTQAACSAAPAQRFTIDSGKPVVLDNVTCAVSGTGAARTLTYTFYQNDNGGYQLQGSTTGNDGTWGSVGAATGVRATSLAVNVSAYATANNTAITYQTRIVDNFGTEVDRGTLVARTANSTNWTCT